MAKNTCSEPALDRKNPPLGRVDRFRRPATDTALEFGRFRLRLRQRQLVADGAAIELGTRALDLLLVLLEADGRWLPKTNY